MWIAVAALAALAVSLAVVAACNRAPQSAAEPPAPAPAASRPMEPSSLAPDLAALKAAVRRPGSVLVVNHWATWCPPCVDELPYLAGVARRYAGRAEFLGVSWDRFSEDGATDEVRGAVDAVRAKTQATFPTVIAPPDPKGVARELGLTDEFIPQTFVFAADGAVVWQHSGEIFEDAHQKAFTDAIDAALAKTKPGR